MTDIIKRIAESDPHLHEGVLQCPLCKMQGLELLKDHLMRVHCFPAHVFADYVSIGDLLNMLKEERTGEQPV